MKVIVLGAGVVGTTTAYYLSEKGNEVTVIDRRDGPGLETSFANGGQISASHVTPWAHKGVIVQILKWLGQEDAPLLIRPRPDLQLLKWSLRFLANCTDKRTALNIERRLRIALFSRSELGRLRAALSLDYDQGRHGIIHFYRNRKALDGAVRMAGWMQQFGLDLRLMDRAALIEREPALAAMGKDLLAGSFTCDDESGDAYKFTRAIAEQARRKGAVFKYGHTIKRLERRGRRLTGIVTDQGRFSADSYVVCLGSYSPLVLKNLQLDVPIYPCKGYSVTFDVSGLDTAPVVSLIDDEHKMVYSRLGNRLRVAGMAELNGYNPEIAPIRGRNIRQQARRLFPDLATAPVSDTWAGLRPVTPDSVPIIGASPYENLYLNTGHGTLGWTMACGSAAAIAALLNGETPPVALDGLGLDRF